MANASWQYDEFKQIGTDYESLDEVREYDRRMNSLRNIPKEISDALDLIILPSNGTLLELGCGTGEFAVTAAKQCSKVYAADISRIMLEYARSKAVERGVSNIEFHNAGFLTYEHIGEPLDAVVTQLALHHLPDFWKAVALSRLCDILKVGGKFFLRDVVFSFDIKNYRETLDSWVGVVRQTCEANAAGCESHIRDEYSTTMPLMEELLRGAGFDIVHSEYTAGVFATYLCQKR